MAKPGIAFLPATVLAILALVGNGLADPPVGSGVVRTTRIPGGTFRPFYKAKVGSPGVEVRPFLMDSLPITRADYLEFVRARPEWRKSRVRPLFAEGGYLADWPGDLDPGSSGSGEPVVFVSWFAAKAYCACHGGRLPTLAEWETAAGMGNAQGDNPFGFAMAPGGASGTGPVFGRAWEWIADFNSVLVSGGSEDGNDPASGLFCGAGARANDPGDYAAFLRYSFRSSLKANYTLKNLGFRCARNLP